MKLWMKLAGCGIMTVAAVCCASAAISGITGDVSAEEDAGEGVLDWPLAIEDAEFVLREYDRALLSAGLPAADKDEVLTLLEDLGS